MRRQQEQEQLRQQEELQRLQDDQRRQMREYYVRLADMYEDMAKAAEAQGDEIMGYYDRVPGRSTIEQQIQAERYYQLAYQYRLQAYNYQLMANSQ